MRPVGESLAQSLAYKIIFWPSAASFPAGILAGQ